MRKLNIKRLHTMDPLHQVSAVAAGTQIWLLREYSPALRVQSHGVSYSEISKLPAILYLYTGQDDYRKFAAAAQKRVFDHHMLIDGIPSSSEGYAGTTALDEHETCDITDHAWNWTYLLEATGDGRYGDAIERACFNAHPGVTKPDWTGIQYFGSPNQFLANLNCDHGTERWFGSRRMAYQPNPAQVIGCCGGNKHRFVPNYAMNMWMGTKENGIAATLYGPSTVSAKVGAKKEEGPYYSADQLPLRRRDSIRSEDQRSSNVSVCAQNSCMVCIANDQGEWNSGGGCAHGEGFRDACVEPSGLATS